MRQTFRFVERLTFYYYFFKLTIDQLKTDLETVPILEIRNEIFLIFSLKMY